MTTDFDWTTGPLADGLHCYGTHQFFEAHEHWESVWLTLHEPEKSFLQALVQISAALHHLQRSNRAGAVSLLTRSLRRLDVTPSPFCCIDTAQLRADLRVWLETLESSNADLPAAFPAFRVLTPSDDVHRE